MVTTGGGGVKKVFINREVFGVLKSQWVGANGEMFKLAPRGRGFVPGREEFSPCPLLSIYMSAFCVPDTAGRHWDTATNKMSKTPRPRGLHSTHRK